MEVRIDYETFGTQAGKANLTPNIIYAPTVFREGHECGIPRQVYLTPQPPLQFGEGEQNRAY